MLREDNEGPAASAFQALVKTIEDVTISFEGQVYGKPFFPRN